MVPSLLTWTLFSFVSSLCTWGVNFWTAELILMFHLLYVFPAYLFYLIQKLFLLCHILWTPTTIYWRHIKVRLKLKQCTSDCLEVNCNITKTFMEVVLTFLESAFHKVTNERVKLLITWDLYPKLGTKTPTLKKHAFCPMHFQEQLNYDLIYRTNDYQELSNDTNCIVTANLFVWFKFLPFIDCNVAM